VRSGLGWSAGRVQVKFLKLLRVRDGFKFWGCGAGADKKFQPAQDSMTSTVCCSALQYGKMGFLSFNAVECVLFLACLSPRLLTHSHLIEV